MRLLNHPTELPPELHLLGALLKRRGTGPGRKWVSPISLEAGVLNPRPPRDGPQLSWDRASILPPGPEVEAQEGHGAAEAGPAG